VEAGGTSLARGDAASTRGTAGAAVVTLVLSYGALLARPKAVLGILPRSTLPFRNNGEREKMQLVC